MAITGREVGKDSDTAKITAETGEGNGKAEGKAVRSANTGGAAAGAGTGAGAAEGRRKTEEKPFELAFLNPSDKEDSSKKKKKKEKSPGVQENFKHLLTGIFTITANINPIWAVQESEIDLVVEPASRLFERYIAEKAEETSDIVSLVVALSILLVPRIVMTLAVKKEEKGEVRSEQKREVPSGNSSTLPKFAGAYQGSGNFTG